MSLPQPTVKIGMTCWRILKNFGLELATTDDTDVEFLLGYVDAYGLFIHHILPRIQALGNPPGLSYPSKWMNEKTNRRTYLTHRLHGLKSCQPQPVRPLHQE